MSENSILKCLKNCDYDEAIDLCKKEIEKNSNNSDIFYYYFLAQNGDYVNMDFENMSYELYFNKALELANNKKKKEYQIEYDFYRSLEPKMRKAFCYVIRYNYKKFKRVYKSIKKEDLLISEETKKLFDNSISSMANRTKTDYQKLLFYYLMCLIKMVYDSNSINNVLGELINNMGNYDYANTMEEMNKTIGGIKANIYDLFEYIDNGINKAEERRNEFITKELDNYERTIEKEKRTQKNDELTNDDSVDNNEMKFVRVISSIVVYLLILINFFGALGNRSFNIYFLIIVCACIVIYPIIVRKSILGIILVCISYVLTGILYSFNSFSTTLFVGIPIIMILILLLIFEMQFLPHENPEYSLKDFEDYKKSLFFCIPCIVLSIIVIILGSIFIGNEILKAIMINIPICISIVALACQVYYCFIDLEEVKGYIVSALLLLVTIAAIVLDLVVFKNNRLMKIILVGITSGISSLSFSAVDYLYYYKEKTDFDLFMMPILSIIIMVGEVFVTSKFSDSTTLLVMTGVQTPLLIAPSVLLWGTEKYYNVKKIITTTLKFIGCFELFFITAIVVFI